ncbi:hypothetical protein [Butyrivibrio proteoclasticus]|uniref:hypothetical protein n=1 Tax=Butyrivibrio proteoclasticus TaxID=43305 RepID=UPI00047A0ED6|nr:hypothetical protein [Butyrivibrio proteoclasticus]
MLYTNYVWTKKAQILADISSLDETRKAGFPAKLNYEPLEKSPQIAKAWLNEKYIEKVEEKLPFLQFYWKGDNTCASYHMIKMFDENGIEWIRSRTGELMAEIGENGEMVPATYYYVAGNLYGIIEKPKSTSTYFGLSSEELYKKNTDGYTKEEALLCDNNIHAKPFASSLYNAIKKAADYVKLGCSGVEILQCINNKYAVVSY